jgi:hypothetical protein
MPRDPSLNRPQAAALYAFHQQGDGSIERSARAMAISPRTMYALTENEIAFPAYGVGRLWDLYRDEKLACGLIGQTEHPFVFSSAPSSLTTSGEVSAIYKLIASSAKTIESAATAVADGKIDDEERARLLGDLEQIERRAQTLKAALRRG